MREPEGRNAPRADELTAFAEGKPGALHLLELDVTRDASVDSAVARALQLEDRIDVVIVEPGGFKTSFLSNMEMAEDDARVASYGALAEISEKMWDGFTETLQGDEAPDAQRVADAILGVIQTPAGKRPLRTVVDPLMGGSAPSAINRTTDEVQAQLLRGLEMDDLAVVKGP
jgi:NADP-dependent 3-hydroxy acid dehydrogenase YdfG